VLVLAVSTVAACAMAAARGSNAAPGFQAPQLWNALGLAFLLNLMGWMPAPIDVAVFPSVWAVERRKQTGHFATLGEALVDFNIGYIGTVVMAVFFLALGAFVMFGTGEHFGESGIAFSQKLYELYTGTLGGWSFWLVATAGFTCIFSSTLTCFDAYTRMLHACLFHREGAPEERTTGEDRLHWALLAFLAVFTLLMVSVFKAHMLNALKLATVIAFLTAPFVAAINLRVITGAHMPAKARPPRWMMVLSWAGLVFLSGFALLYLWVMAAVGVG
jgi:Mn2+/Fe2+ NRAMP family transporter